MIVFYFNKKNNKLISMIHTINDYLFILNIQNINNFNLINNTSITNFDLFIY